MPPAADLDELFERSTRVEIRPIITLERLIAPGPLLCEIEQSGLADLRPTLETHTPDPPYRELSWGDHTLLFYADQQLLAGLEIFQFARLRWNGRWDSDLELSDDGFQLAHLLAERGHPEALILYQERQQFLELERSAWERWRQARPPCLEQPGDPIGLLHEAYPEEQAAIRALLAWMGQPEPAQPEHLREPVSLLETFPLETVVTALENASEPVLRGGWLFFGGTPRLQYVPRHLREAMRSAR
jgi:hypothetical protein